MFTSTSALTAEVQVLAVDFQVVWVNWIRSCTAPNSPASAVTLAIASLEFLQPRGGVFFVQRRDFAVEFGDFFLQFRLFGFDFFHFSFSFAAFGEFFLKGCDRFLFGLDFFLDFLHFFLFSFAEAGQQPSAERRAVDAFFDRFVQLDGRDADAFTVVGADLEADFFGRVEQVLAVELQSFHRRA